MVSFVVWPIMIWPIWYGACSLAARISTSRVTAWSVSSLILFVKSQELKKQKPVTVNSETNSDFCTGSSLESKLDCLRKGAWSTIERPPVDHNVGTLILSYLVSDWCSSRRSDWPSTVTATQPALVWRNEQKINCHWLRAMRNSVSWWCSSSKKDLTRRPLDESSQSLKKWTRTNQVILVSEHVLRNKLKINKSD